MRRNGVTERRLKIESTTTKAHAQKPHRSELETMKSVHRHPKESKGCNEDVA